MQLASDPFALTQFQMGLMSDSTKAWLNAWTGMAARTAATAASAMAAGTATRQPGLRDVHLAVENAAERLIGDLPDDDKDSLRVRFYTRQLLSALSPAIIWR
jgi:polyhydroxyalkanoate synthase